MKKAIFIIAITMYNLACGQFNKVGINTANPQRMLDINGGLRIRALKNQSENGDYNRVLVANKTNGFVDYLLKSDFLPVPTSEDANKQVFNSIYNRGSDTADETKSVKCGKFVFLFTQNTSVNPNTTDIKFKLSENPGKTIGVYTSMEQNWDGSGFQFYQGTNTSNSSAYSFTTSDWDTLKSFPSANVAIYEQNVIHLQYPEEADFYKLMIYKAEQKTTNSSTSDTSFDFVTVCEKF